MRYIVAISIAVLLLATFYLYADSYFTTDDFINLYWVQLQSPGQMAWHVVNPASHYFRPTGTLFYWLLFRFFDLNAGVYHVFAWFMHTVNTVLVYFVLKRLMTNRSAAATGAMLFASQAAFADIYWSFGTIFDLLSACAFFAGILIWAQEDRSWRRLLLCLLIYLFAIKAKEMAITLPAIWLLWDLSLRTPIRLKQAAQVLIPGVMGLGYGLMKMAELGAISRTDLYYMDIRWITLGRRLAYYFNSFFDTSFRWQIWAIGFVVLLIVMLLSGKRAAVFLQIYLLITFLPVIFMINHRALYLAYIPFLGICGMAGFLVKTILDWRPLELSDRTATAVGCVLFPLMCWGTYVTQKALSVEARAWQRPMIGDYRSFVTQIRSLPAFPPNETIYFDSHPLYFTADHLFNATQVALRRTDIQTQLVSEFPESARYRLHYEDSKLTVVAPK